MTARRIRHVGVYLLLLGALLLPPAPQAADTLPSRLSDEEFWTLSTESSEPNGFFRSDNLLSNEIWLQRVIPDLKRLITAPSAYLGVGPEQNFTYIAAIRPKMAFIVDIRRGNLDLHLMYKAIFELSADRADFVSRLFSRRRPEGLDRSTSAFEMFAAFRATEADEALYRENLEAIEGHLTKTHRFALSQDDLDGIEYVYHAFSFFGPSLSYSSTGGFGGRYQPTYADLMIATDESGEPRSYLASEESFAYLKDLESRNLIVPIVGNFAGPKAIRAVGEYLTARGATVSAFYLSNVEQYLHQDRLWGDFCRNVARLPIEPASTFIRSVRRGSFGPGRGLDSVLGSIRPEMKDCGPDGQ